MDANLHDHAHAQFPSLAFASCPKVDAVRRTSNGVAAVMPRRWGDHLGVVDLTLNHRSGSWSVTGSRGSIRPIVDRVGKKSITKSDPMVEKAIGEEHALIRAYVLEKVAVSSEPICGYFGLVGDGPSVQMVTNA